MRVSVAFSLLLMASMATAQEAEISAVKAAREQSNRAIEERDIKGFSHSLAPDFLMVRGSGTLVASRAAYIELFRQDFADPKSIVYQRTPEKIEISTAAPLAAEHGHWVGTTNGRVAYSGTYLAMWRHTEEGWKIRSELFVVLSCGDREICKQYASGPKK
jgi:ketosteroid isomerase-like protein